MSVTPEKDPNYIYAHPYATLIADEYRMRGGYCIVRPGGTDDHLMLLTRAGRGLFVPLAAVPPRLRSAAARDCKAWTESTATQPRLNHPSCRIQERFRHNHPSFVKPHLFQRTAGNSRFAAPHRL